tara:strand:+ start:222 stop:1730 length:1509 start_codon:yes stop_codon:yes gene_type:complete
LNKFKKKYSAFYLTKLVKNMNKQELNIGNNFFGHKFNISEKKKLEITIKQKFNNNNNNFYINFFYSYGKSNKLSIPLPNSWYIYLKNNNFLINYTLSRYFFSLFVIKSFLRSQYFILRNIFFNNFPKFNKAAIFMNMNNKTFGNPNLADDIVDQLKSKKIINHDELIILNTNKLILSKNFKNKYNVTHSIFPRINFFQSANLLFYNLIAILQFFIYFFTNKFEKILILEELIYLKYYSLLKISKNKYKYFFHNIGLGYKPFWTHFHESNFENIFMYCYSANMEHFQFSKKNKYYPHSNFDLLNWKSYILWDNYQKKYIEKYNLVQSNYYSLGYINWLGSKKLNIKNNSKFKIAIFDVTPMRISLYASHGHCIPLYYSKEIYKKFYKDINDVSLNFTDISLYRKPKRKTDNNFIGNNFISNIDKKLLKNYTTLDYETSITDIIKFCQITICMPFTSPALIAKYFNSRVIFYDPTNIINIKTYHGIEIIKTKLNLLNYLKDNLR